MRNRDGWSGEWPAPRLALGWWEELAGVRSPAVSGGGGWSRSNVSPYIHCLMDSCYQCSRRALTRISYNGNMSQRSLVGEQTIDVHLLYASL